MFIVLADCVSPHVCNGMYMAYNSVYLGIQLLFVLRGTTKKLSSRYMPFPKSLEKERKREAERMEA